MLYMPPGNATAMVHYEDTIRNKVDLARIAPFISQDLRAELLKVFGANRVAVWGSQAGPQNRSKFVRMAPGDDVLIVEGPHVKLIGKVAAKVDSEALSRELWHPLGDVRQTPWQLIYFIANPRELSVPFAQVGELFGYQPNYQLQGFTAISQPRLNAFYARYDDLYSVLVKLQNGEPVYKRPESEAQTVIAPVELTLDTVDAVLRDEAISDHVRMQWKLARLGIKAGERVWVPRGDQTKIRNAYQFDSFDPEFASGIDLPHSYIENIDVIWKQEFRIGAAYEIENSTSIYSGLLRFADLNVVAPNTLYPMFIVAPRERENRVRDQLRRPAFKRLELKEKVRFLSYEAVDKVDEFFAGKESGVSVDLMFGQSEAIV